MNLSSRDSYQSTRTPESFRHTSGGSALKHTVRGTDGFAPIASLEFSANEKRNENRLRRLASR